MRGVLYAWRWCWCWAIWKFSADRGNVLIFLRSEHIKGIVHAVVARREDLAGLLVEESVPEGEKREGWAAVRHALTAHWGTQRRPLR